MDELAWDTGFWDGVEHARAEMARADFQNIGLVMVGYGRHVRECRKRAKDPNVREWRRGWFAGRAEYIQAYIEQRRAQT